MFDYLIEYGIKSNKINIGYEDVDINDRLMLQDQINNVRNSYFKLLSLLDDVQGQIILCNKNISDRIKELISDNNGVKNNSIFQSDDQYNLLEAKLEALKAGSKMIENQIEFCKSDLKILNSVFYNKF